MYKKNKILSAIAAVAILSSGAIAFDISMIPGDSNATELDHANGTVVDSNQTDVSTGYVANAYADQGSGKVGFAWAHYKGAVATDEKLRLSDNSLKGDALIYPAFQQENGWTTDITVRNVKDVAIIAKAVIYRDTDSREMLDFNIYLSAHDVARFTITDGKVTTYDGSIIGSLNGEGTVSDPSDGVDRLSDTAFADIPLTETPKTVKSLDEKTFKLDYNGDGTKTWPGGYVIVYGMMQADPTPTREEFLNADDPHDLNLSATIDTNEDKSIDTREIKVAAAYHNQHEKLFYDYRKVLDECRPGWRLAYDGAFANGMMNITDENGRYVYVNSPSLNPDCMHGIRGTNAEFEDTSVDALIGEVEISHAGDKRNVLLPATALANFTVGKMIMLWSEGEYASIQDRRLVPDANNIAVYNLVGLLDDADAFMIKRTFYTYKAGDAQAQGHNNSLLLTQPMKRPLVQANNIGRFWRSNPSNYYLVPDYNDAKGDTGWGYFEFKHNLYDENEREYAEESGLTNITSPYSANKLADPYRKELQPIKDMEEDFDDMTGETEHYFAVQTNGYADINIKNSPRKLPAIVTQMTSSVIEGESQINWIYSPVDKVQ